MVLVRHRKWLGSRLGSSEAGFTLVELLVVMLILGVLAAIALPAFFSQRSKAGDAQAKEYAHTAQVTMETYASSNGGYENVTVAKLKEIEPTLNSVGTFTVTGPEGSGNPSKTGYQVTVNSTTGNTFSVRNASGRITFPCTVSSTARGGCPGSGAADGVWG